MEKRFGLRGGRPKTLEAIGREYKITRERVRQIEAEALRCLKTHEVSPEIREVCDTVRQHIALRGACVAEREILADVSESGFRPHILFLLSISDAFHYFSETPALHARWALDRASASAVESVLHETVRTLESRGTLTARDALMGILEHHAPAAALRRGLTPEACASYVGVSKLIRVNPYGEYGLLSWPHVNPRGVKDKAYLALAKAGDPLHFRDVAKAIEGAGWSKKRVHPQTVHNELIKDTRFVLVGRGMYALHEWGYEPGVVKDVLISVLKSAARPLPKEEIVRLVSEKRVVKPQTVFLNLQNRDLFKKTDGGYTLV